MSQEKWSREEVFAIIREIRTLIREAQSILKDCEFHEVQEGEK